MSEEDKIAQKEEIDLLNSVYPDEIKSIENNLFILINPYLEKEIAIEIINDSTEIKDSEALEMMSPPPAPLSRKSSLGSSYEINVKYLPPIQISIHFPPSYPSSESLTYEIGSSWLSPQKLSILCNRIDEIIEEWKGTCCVSNIIDCLQHDMFVILKIKNKISLSEIEMKSLSTTDERVSTEFESLDITCKNILSFDNLVKRKEFNSVMHACSICYSDKPGKEFIKLGCDHYFCSECLNEFACNKIVSGQIEINCPNASCSFELSPNIISVIVSPELFEKYEKFQLQKTLDSMPDVVYCPRCAAACIEDKDFAICDSCSHSFCTQCFDGYHPGSICLSPDIRLKLMEKKLNSSGLGQSVGEERKSLKNQLLQKATRMREDLMSETFLKSSRDVMKCPKCGVNVSKTEGCNKMTCSVCHCYFCFLCNKDITDVGYDHFKATDPPSKKSCVLFSTDEIDRWNNMMNNNMVNLVGGRDFEIEQYARGDLVNQRIAIRSCPCPMCGCVDNIVQLPNRNNHIRCFQCGCSFCNSCRKTILNTSKHYKPVGVGGSGCKQHTKAW